MAKALRKPHFGASAGAGGTAATARRRPDWRKAMSDNVAYALLVYTALQILVTMKAIKGSGSGSALPYLSLIVLVALIIPACRAFEKRWESIGDKRAHDPALRGSFRRDQALLWLLAIGLPFVFTGLFTAVARLF
jgi:hypothetical protein